LRGHQTSRQKYDLTSLGVDIDESRLFTSVIVRMELLAKPKLQPEEEQKVLDFLNDIVIAPLDYSVGNISDRKGWRTALRYALCENPVVERRQLTLFDEEDLNPTEKKRVSEKEGEDCAYA
jgi:hypothetical protein